jgi:hypothetical protein
MKKIIFIFLAFLISYEKSSAVDDAKLLEIKIVSSVVNALTRKNPPDVCFYNISEDEKILYEKYSNFIITNCENSDIILVKNLSYKKSFKKPAFALDYLSFKNCLDCLGGFYWKKGRSQIVLIKEMLDKFNINVPEQFKPFVISLKIVKLW